MADVVTSPVDHKAIPLTQASQPRATICLAMMVRDEASIIERALSSVLDWIDAWVVHDTGSEDHTPDIVRTVLINKPGKLVRTSWKNFAENRTAVVTDARTMGCDYILVMDADQTLVVVDENWRSTLDSDAYNVQIRHSNTSYPHPWLLKASKPWYWKGATHEYLDCDESFEYSELTEIHLFEHADSHRRVTGAKILEDRQLLEQAYADDPTNARTLFYLGMLCRDEHKWPCAIEWFRKRIAAAGWAEEVWCAYYQIARCHEWAGAWEQAAAAYFEAYSYDHRRAESLYRLGIGFLHRRMFHPALLMFERGSCIDNVDGKLFVEEYIYDWAIPWGQSICLRILKRHDEADPIELRILQAERTPARVVADLLISRSTKTIMVLPE